MAETESKSSIDEGQSAAATRGASTGSSSETAGTSSGATEAQVGAQQRFASAEVLADIGQAEAWTTNMKHRFDLTNENADLLRQQSVELRENGVTAANNLIQASSTAVANVIQAGAQETIAKMSSSTDAVHKTTRTSLFEVDKLENLDENNPYLVALVKVISQIVATKTDGA